MDEINHLQSSLYLSFNTYGKFTSSPIELKIDLLNPPENFLPDFIRNKVEKITLSLDLKNDNQNFNAQFINHTILLKTYSLNAEIQDFIEKYFYAYT